MMLAQGALVCLIAVLLIVCALIAEWRSIDRTLEKLREWPDERYLLPLIEGDAGPQLDCPVLASVHWVPEGALCAGVNGAGWGSDIAVGGQRNPPRFTIPTVDATRNGSGNATVLPFSRAVAG